MTATAEQSFNVHVHMILYMQDPTENEKNNFSQKLETWLNPNYYEKKV